MKLLTTTFLLLASTISGALAMGGPCFEEGATKCPSSPEDNENLGVVFDQWGWMVLINICVIMANGNCQPAKGRVGEDGKSPATGTGSIASIGAARKVVAPRRVLHGVDLTASPISTT
jgi:hypothetical protein